MPGHQGYTTRQAAYDLRKLRGKQFIDKPARTRRYHVPPDAARTITALLALRDHVIAPILAGIRSPRTGRKPKIWTTVDRDYETPDRHAGPVRAHRHPDASGSDQDLSRVRRRVNDILDVDVLDPRSR